MKERKRERERTDPTPWGNKHTPKEVDVLYPVEYNNLMRSQIKNKGMGEEAMGEGEREGRYFDRKREERKRVGERESKERERKEREKIGRESDRERERKGEVGGEEGERAKERERKRGK